MDFTLAIAAHAIHKTHERSWRRLASRELSQSTLALRAVKGLPGGSAAA
jgi:hypothetical protein